jgi:hypothetical protein
MSFLQHAVDDFTHRAHVALATIVVAGITSTLNTGVTNMILELGKVSVETKGPPFVAGQEVYNGQIALWDQP